MEIEDKSRGPLVPNLITWSDLPDGISTVELRRTLKGSHSFEVVHKQHNVRLSCTPFDREIPARDCFEAKVEMLSERIWNGQS